MHILEKYLGESFMKKAFNDLVQGVNKNTQFNVDKYFVNLVEDQIAKLQAWNNPANNNIGQPIIKQRACILGTHCSKYSKKWNRPNFSKWICTYCGPICAGCREKHPMKM